MAQTSNDVKKTKDATELNEFDAVFIEIVETLTKDGKENCEISDAYNWFKEALEYNVPHGKKNRGISVVTSFKKLVQDPSEEDIKLAQIMGWCVELLQAFFLVSDDIMDHSISRRGLPCWYKKEGVGLIAINDAFFMECSIYKLLKKYASHKPYYINLVELFLQTTLQTVTGQCLDLITAPAEACVDFSKFNMKRYNAIVKWKTAFYSFYLPVAIAMYMAGISDEETHGKAKTILLEMGHFFQVQDDYLDCYGTPEIIGKIGTDIQDNKCGWLIVKALEIASDEQKKELEASYGRWDDDAIVRVKNIYRELDIEGVYKQYEEQSYESITQVIKSLDSDVPQEVFLDFANRIYKRQK
ncbi:farnesyl pyrophosphate synthase-like [Physella acuta]|uniref:farnesyl pyrophosphate synthase-like n=1 Tax=Physella acuta TaxID=109671 RepID=UPI0027DCFA0C|nr:farnesyl pyrophosphate synthase-like [Physella acuta]